MSGCVLIDLAGTTLGHVEAEVLALPQVAGVVLFEKNYIGRFQLMGLVHAIRSAAPDALIFVDQEGGEIQRFSEPEFTRLPTAKALGESSVTHCREIGEQMASELLACGIDASLAPVLDLHDDSSVIIGQKSRSFHQQAERVIQSAEAFIAGMNYAGMQATGKHFPGHGRQVLDSHQSVIEDPRDWQALQEEMSPFLALKDQLAAWMPAHIIYPKIDTCPVGQSMVWRDKIRQTCGYSGVLISDCLSMAGAAISVEERASEVQFWADSLRAYARVCDYVILTHLTDHGRLEDQAALAQILLTAFPDELLASRVSRAEELRGRLSGEFCQNK